MESNLRFSLHLAKARCLHLLCSLHGRHGRLSGQLVRNHKKPTSATGCCGVRTRSQALDICGIYNNNPSNEHILQVEIKFVPKSTQKHQNINRLWLAQWKCGPSATSAHVKQHWPMACFLLISWIEDWPWLEVATLLEPSASKLTGKCVEKVFYIVLIF